MRTDEMQGSDRELGDLSEADVVCDCANRDDDFVGEVDSVGGLLHNPGQQQGCAVHLGEEEAVEENLVEVRIRVLRQEPVELRVL
jgi:hypothetical protein